MERPVPTYLELTKVTLLFIYGKLFNAAVDLLEKNLPDSARVKRSVLILFLRGRDEVGSTILKVLVRYSAGLQANHGKLILAGVGEHVYHQLQKTSLMDELGMENVYRASSIIGDSTVNAYQDAVAWLNQDNGLASGEVEIHNR